MCGTILVCPVLLYLLFGGMVVGDGDSAGSCCIGLKTACQYLFFFKYSFPALFVEGGWLSHLKAVFDVRRRIALSSIGG
jgi:hypothetical protein